eukprot:742436-Pleurochrysis_carterae.AAC.1
MPHQSARSEENSCAAKFKPASLLHLVLLQPWRPEVIARAHVAHVPAWCVTDGCTKPFHAL